MLQNWVYNTMMGRMQANLYVTDIHTDRILFMNKTMQEAFGLEEDPKSMSHRVCVILIAAFPILVTFAMGGTVPTVIIVAAQVLNTFILPLSVVLIAILANRRKILGEQASSVGQNIAMAIVAAVVILLTYSSIPAILALF